MKKRLISLLIAVAICVTSVLSVNVSIALGATSGTCGNNALWSYDASTTTLTISGSGATSNFGVSVSKRVPWYSYKSNIKKVIVEDGITSLGQLIFYNLTALTSVSLPSTLKVIDGGTLNYGAFRECTALKTITLPEGIETIGAMAFRGCTALQSVRFPNTLTNLGMGAFRDCTSLETVTYGTGMASTGAEAFYDSGVRYVNFSSAITTIDNYSFFNTKIVSIEIPEHITSIGTRAFANCTFINSVTVYNKSCAFNGVIGEDPFNGSNQTITFYGHSGSTTQTYAEEKGYTFISIDECAHQNKEERIVKAPTCGEPGIVNVVCLDCDFLVSESEIPAIGHKWKLIETAEQTKADGHIYTFYVCENEGCNGEQTKIEHVANVEGYYEYSNTATCTRPGIEKYTCTVEGCGNVDSSVAPSGNHQVAEYTVTLEPTCTTEGTQSGTCSVCNETITQSIPATGHTYDVIDNIDNTAEDGHTYVVNKCSVCSVESVVPTHVEWIEGYYNSRIVTNPGCVVDGVRADTCSVEGCGKVRSVDIPANGEHVWYETTRTEPTCTAAGKIYYACENCTLTKSENIDALGHSYVLNEESSVAPNCTVAGYSTYKCSVCNATKKDVLSATGHTADPENSVVTLEPTCTTTGEKVSVCTVCGEEFTITLEALNHIMENVVINIEDKPGHTLVTPTCTRCGQTDSSNVVHNEWIDGYYTSEVVTAGSCTTPEIVRDTCSLCSLTRNNTKAAAGHSYSYSTTTNNGKMQYVCANCSNVESRSPQSLMLMFRQYINTKPVDSSLGYAFDINLDGIINAKDYALLVRARQLEIAAQ